MANDMVAVMERLGFPRFSVAGHDRGGRVAYRLALDHPQRVGRLAVLDILPVAEVWERADKRLATAYWPWSLLAQPEPLPERRVSAAPDAVVDNALSGWGSAAHAFNEAVRRHYVGPCAIRRRFHAICEEYRAAATLDHEHDRQDREAGRRIACSVLVLWSGRGALNTWYADAGGPLALWRAWADDVRGRPLQGGHFFFPEETPERTAAELSAFSPRASNDKSGRSSARLIFAVPLKSCAKAGVKGCPRDFLGITTGVPQIAAPTSGAFRAGDHRDVRLWVNRVAFLSRPGHVRLSSETHRDGESA